MSTPFAFSLFYSLLGFAILRWLRKRLSHHPSPPGPPALPIIGNALQMPMTREWLKFSNWSKTYGSIMYLSVFGRPIIVLSSSEAISELLEKRSSIYSDRPVFPMATEMIGYDRYIVLEPYGNRLREGRKLILGNLSARKAPELQQVQELKVGKLLQKLLSDPAQFRLHLRVFVAAVVFQVSHGHYVEDFEDPFVKLAEEATHDFSLSVRPGSYLVDSLPFLRYVPDWFPGTAWKVTAKERRKTLHRIRDEPYEYVKQQISEGTALPSVTASVIESNNNPDAEEEDLQRTSTCMLYAAAADTTVSAVESFILIMALYPEVQRKAQAELDSVVEAGRLPNYIDRPKLPYIGALIKEIHRWNPVLPLALPHSLMQDDVYEGYHIPKGATVFANTWAVLHDPSLYPNPLEVIPERYLASDENLNPDPRPFSFGYGRRVCPGQLLAEDPLYIVVVSVLSTMNIGGATRPDGTPMDSNAEYTAGAISHPEAFHCDITPRSAEAQRLVAAVSGVEKA